MAVGDDGKDGRKISRFQKPSLQEWKGDEDGEESSLGF